MLRKQCTNNTEETAESGGGYFAGLVFCHFCDSVKALPWD
jgi:hypothetical protein